jgi:hypothetical protein
MLSAEDLLAGSGLTFEVEIPADILSPSNGASGDSARRRVRLRPLTVHDLQLIARAAKESDGLMATFMVQRALVEPEMSVSQVAAMHAGLATFLLEQVNRISGITAGDRQIMAATESPLAKAAFVLAKEFGWTPQQVSELTLGQVLVHLQMLQGKAQK